MLFIPSFGTNAANKRLLLTETKEYKAALHTRPSVTEVLPLTNTHGSEERAFDSVIHFDLYNSRHNIMFKLISTDFDTIVFHKCTPNPTHLKLDARIP